MNCPPALWAWCLIVFLAMYGLVLILVVVGHRQVHAAPMLSALRRLSWFTLGLCALKAIMVANDETHNPPAIAALLGLASMYLGIRAGLLAGCWINRRRKLRGFEP